MQRLKHYLKLDLLKVLAHLFPIQKYLDQELRPASLFWVPEWPQLQLLQGHSTKPVPEAQQEPNQPSREFQEHDSTRSWELLLQQQMLPRDSPLVLLCTAVIHQRLQ